VICERKRRSGDCEFMYLVSERRSPDQHRADSLNTGWVKVPVKFPALAVVKSEQKAYARSTKNSLPHLKPVHLRYGCACRDADESINSLMRSRSKNHLLCAAVAFLAACQSPPTNQGNQPNKPNSATGQPTTPSSYEVNSFDPLQREPGIGLRGSSYFGRGP